MQSMSRRDFTKAAVAGALMGPTSLAASAASEATHDDSGRRLTKPLPQQIQWQDCELGLVYHFDIPVYLPEGWKWNAAYQTVLDPQVYNPVELDTDQWLEAAQAAGAGYAVFTATHMGGFLQWQSDLYPYGVKQTRWRDGKADIVEDFIASCHKYKIRPGIYISTRFNAYWNVSTTKVNYGKGGDERKQSEYVRTCEKMVEELCSRYGPLLELWFDGGVETPENGGPDVLPIVDKHQPDIVFYHSMQRAHHRWAGNERGVTGYPCWATMPGTRSNDHSSRAAIMELLPHGDPGGQVWMPPMCDAPVRNHEWFWRPNEESKLYSGDDLVNMYYNSVGRNGNLILGATPDSSGLIPPADMERLDELGKSIREQLGNSAAKTTGTGHEIVLDLPESRRIERVVVMEDIAQGERVRAYTIEGLIPGNTWQTLCDGVSIGHKRIQQFPPTEVGRVRLRVSEAAATPVIKELSVYAHA